MKTRTKTQTLTSKIQRAVMQRTKPFTARQISERTGASLSHTRRVLNTSTSSTVGRTGQTDSTGATLFVRLGW